jgi:hypothetical protein
MPPKRQRNQVPPEKRQQHSRPPFVVSDLQADDAAGCKAFKKVVKFLCLCLDLLKSPMDRTIRSEYRRSIPATTQGFLPSRQNRVFERGSSQGKT